MRWPATGRPSGVGSSSTATSAAMASKRPQLLAIQLGCRTVAGCALPAGTCSATDMGSSVMLKSGKLSPGPTWATLSKIKGLRTLTALIERKVSLAGHPYVSMSGC